MAGIHHPRTIQRALHSPALQRQGDGYRQFGGAQAVGLRSAGQADDSHPADIHPWRHGPLIPRALAQ